MIGLIELPEAWKITPKGEGTLTDCGIPEHPETHCTILVTRVEGPRGMGWLVELMVLVNDRATIQVVVPLRGR